METNETKLKLMVINLHPCPLKKTSILKISHIVETTCKKPVFLRIFVFSQIVNRRSVLFRIHPFSLSLCTKCVVTHFSEPSSMIFMMHNTTQVASDGTFLPIVSKTSTLNKMLDFNPKSLMLLSRQL
jgi:hypothetical protein